MLYMLMQNQATERMDYSSFAELALDSTNVLTPLTLFEPPKSKTFLLNEQKIIDLIDNVILAKDKGLTRQQMISQIDLLLDKESLEAVHEARQEYEQGKLKSYENIDELLRDLNAG